MMTATETTPTLLHGCDTVVKLWRQQCLERGERIAHREKDLGIWQSYSWRDYYEHARAIGVALLSMGLERGQPVSILSEDNKEWLYCDLGIAGAGGISNGVYTTDSAEQLAYLVNDSGSAFLFVENDEQLDKYLTVRDQVPTLKKVIVFDRKGLRDFQDPMVMFLDELYELGNGIADAEQQFSASIEQSRPDDIRMLIYTSGTTGAPKGVVRPTGGHLVALNWSMKNIYNVDPGDVFWAASDVGWVVGHSYICYAPLVHGNTAIVFEGKPVGTPDAGTFWRVISEHNVRSFFTAPTAFRAIKRDDPKGEFVRKYDLSCLRVLYLAGERADPDTLNWAADQLGVPVVDHWWQTETGWPITGIPVGIEKMKVKIGSSGVPFPGYDIDILDEAGQPQAPGTLGAVAIKLPLPPGTLPTLWNAEDRFRKSYLTTYKGYYETGDAGMIDEDGYLYIMARTDDVINVAGHRLSTGGMEEVLAGHPDVAECAVIGVTDPLKGQLPVGFVCLTKGVNRPHEEITAECVKLVRDRIGPVAAFKLCVVVDRLPKTRSGKILRATMVKIADGQEFKLPATIDDPAILDEISEALQTIGYAKT